MSAVTSSRYVIANGGLRECLYFWLRFWYVGVGRLFFYIGVYSFCGITGIGFSLNLLAFCIFRRV